MTYFLNAQDIFTGKYLENKEMQTITKKPNMFLIPYSIFNALCTSASFSI
jgi:hypothetical protein